MRGVAARMRSSGWAVPAHRSSAKNAAPRPGHGSNAERAGFCGGVALGDLAPVHHVPPRLEIIGTAVLVRQVIGMLPDVVAEQRAPAVHDRSVLVRPRLDREL